MSIIFFTAMLIALLSISSVAVSGFAPLVHSQQLARTSSVHHNHKQQQHTGTGKEQKHLGRLKYHHMESDDGIDSNSNGAANNNIMNNNKNMQTIFTTVLLSLTIIFSTPLTPTANAGFGPSRAATTSSPPNLVTPTQLGVQDTSAKKLKQLIGGSLSPNRLQDFSVSIDGLTDALKSLISSKEVEGEGVDNTISTTTDAAIEEREASWAALQAQLERLSILKEQIANQEQMLSKLESQPYWFNFLAAFIGSVVSTLVMHPLDTIKTRLQVSSIATGKDDDEDDDNSDDGEDTENIIVGYNIMSLYEGLGANILKEGPPSALYLGVYESVKYTLLPQFGPQSLLFVYLLAGAAGETCGSIVRAPAEAIKSTVQTTYCTALEASAQVFGTSASRANVVRAWSSSLWRDVPFGAIQLAIFELTKR